MSITFKTHLKFKSNITFIKTANDIHNEIGKALSNQYMFERTTSAWEIQDWDYSNLQKIIINVEKISHLYYIFTNTNNDNSQQFELLAKMDYKRNEPPLYIKMKACLGNGDFDFGFIFVSRYPEFFIKSIIQIEKIKHQILDSVKINNNLLNLSFPQETHPNFKSFVECINTATAIRSEIAGALFYQSIFQKKTTRMEKKNWHINKLQKIKINVNQIDRLYNINFIRNKIGSKYTLLARMNYKNKFLYLKLLASCKYVEYECHPKGIIMISENVFFFVKDFVKIKCYKNLILNDKG